MFDDYAELRKVKEVAAVMADYADWTQLYDERKLAVNTVPVYAATYVEDMWVFRIVGWSTRANEFLGTSTTSLRGKQPARSRARRSLLQTPCSTTRSGTRRRV